MPNQGPNQKWLTDYMAETWVEIHFKEATYTVLGVGFVSAENWPFRDPKKITISYSDLETGKWVKSAEVKPEWDGQRNTLLKFKIPVCKTNKFKFDMSHDGDHEHFHLCQI